jgi:ABC-type glycerol-3-phosphate transport system permease component
MRRYSGEISKYVMLTVFGLFSLTPFFWVWFASVKTQADLRASPLGLPKNPTMQNYRTAWTDGRLGKYFLNTSLYTVIVVVATIILASLAGYAFARYEFAGRDAMFYVFAIGLTLPFQAIMIPLYYLLKSLQMIGSIWGMIVPQTAISLPFGVFIMRAFFQGLPRELEESARIDGCTELGVFRRVILPISKPGLTALGIFTFVNCWNAYLLPLIYLQNTEKWVVTIGLENFGTKYTTDFSLKMAGTTIISLPVLALYMAFQRQFIKGLTAGAIKG